MVRPKVDFKIGDLVRYRQGPTALLRIESVYDYGGKIGREFTGLQMCGDIHRVYESDCTKATPLDHARWEDYKDDRCRILADRPPRYKDVPF